MTTATPERVIRYEPRGALLELGRHYEAEVLVSGPAGTGKSRACMELVHRYARAVPGMRGLFVRKTRVSMTQSVLDPFDRYVLDEADGVRFHHQAGEYRYPNGSRIVVRGMDEPTRIMSTEYDIAYVQEATELTENDWESITTRLRHGKMPGGHQLLADCNPSAPTHWLKARCDAGKTLLIESRHEDNPTVTPEYLARLDALSGVRYLRLRLGIWAAAEGVIYEDWDRSRHVIDRFPIPAEWPRYWAIDFGYVNPFVWQAWAQDPDGALYLYREIYRTHRIVEDHARAILAATAGEPRPRAIICDHDAEDRATLERHLGMRTTPATKTVSPGIQAVEARLRVGDNGKARLYLLRETVTAAERDPLLVEAHKPWRTEDEFPGYVWDTSTQKPKEQPMKIDDHGVDATRYAVAHFDVKIKRHSGVA